jgi:hypothetical protein
MTSPRRGFTPFEEFPSSAAGAPSLGPVALVPLPAWSGHRSSRSRCGSRSRRTGNRGAFRAHRPRRDVRDPESSLAPANRLEHPEAPVRPRADPHFSVARCGTGEPMPWRADRHRRRHRSGARGAVGPGWSGMPNRHPRPGCAPTPESAIAQPSGGRNRGRPRCARTAEAERADPSRTLRSGRLQGLSPPTSPLCRRAVAGVATPDPSMGFVPLQGPLALRTSPDPCRGRAGAAQPRLRDARDAESAVRPIAGAAGIPPDGCPPKPRRSGETRRTRLAEAARERAAFSAGRPRPGTAARALRPAEAIVERGTVP